MPSPWSHIGPCLLNGLGRRNHGRTSAEKLQMKNSSASAMANTQPTAPALDSLYFFRPFAALQRDIRSTPPPTDPPRHLGEELLHGLAAALTQVSDCNAGNGSTSARECFLSG